MTVRDILKMNMDIDVVDDATEELYIAFCGPVELTGEGEKYFAEALDYTVEFSNRYLIVHVDDPEDAVWEHRLEKAKELFLSLAGYCPMSDYDKWIKEVG